MRHYIVNKMKSGSLFMFILLSMPALLFGQTKKNPWSIGAHFGNAEWNGDLGNASYNFNKAFYAFGGVSFARYISPSFDAVANISIGEIGYWSNADSVIAYKGKKYNGSFYGNHYQGSVALKYKFNNGYILKEDARVAPYAFIGVGLSWLYGSRVYYEYKGELVSGGLGQDMTIPSGAGVSVRIGERVNMYLQTSFVYTDHDIRDGVSVRNNDGYVLNQIGATFNFGKRAKPVLSDQQCKCEIFDRDSDGIVDKMDMCPDIPGTFQARGCPDRDWDGIPDTLDKCPDVYGTPRFDGCPDTDGDGVPDYQDSCVTVPGLKQFNGCPDTDGDDVPDHQDSCVTIKGLAQFNGCPDTDGDGIPDNKDACATERGLLQFNGCPDADGDGVPDNLDKCPKELGFPINQGCPEIKESVKKVFDQAITGVQFQPAKAIILTKSYSILDNVAKVMRENPEYYLIINGHTDGQGDDTKNLKLSDDRANAVRLYLIKKGISAGRLESHGFGEAEPIDTNDTPEGRSKNRRVEFKVKTM